MSCNPICLSRCTLGEYWENHTCYKCPEDLYGDGVQCHKCPPGFKVDKGFCHKDLTLKMVVAALIALLTLACILVAAAISYRFRRCMNRGICLSRWCGNRDICNFPRQIAKSAFFREEPRNRQFSATNRDIISFPRQIAKFHASVSLNFDRWICSRGI